MLIAIEGIDGSGKRTQAERLAESLGIAGVSTYRMSFPQYGKTKAAEAVSKYLNGQFGPLKSIPQRLAALLFAEDRFQSRDILDSKCRIHDIVLVDRYVSSNLAYQGARCPMPARNTFIDWLANVEYNMFGMKRADLTVFLDVPAPTSAKLVAKKVAREYTDLKADLHESDVTYLSVCREVYMDLYERQYGSRWLRINCMDESGLLRSIEAIHEEVAARVSDIYHK